MFREKVKGMLETFLRELATMQEDFSRLQPTTKDGVSSTTALAFIAKWKGTVQAAHQKVCPLNISVEAVLSLVLQPTSKNFPKQLPL